MPLVKSKSNKARSENIRREVHAGRPPVQAEAIAYSMQRKMRGMHGGKKGKPKA